MTWLLLAAAYLIGGIPTSYLVARAIRGIDLREHGSGNLGATNAYRLLGKRAAIPIFIVDILKGFLPVFLFPGWDAATSAAWAFAYGGAAIAGHVFSPYVGFKGGKGVATGAGVFLALAPFAVGVGFVVWLTLTLTTGYVSLASMAAALTLPMVIGLRDGTVPTFWAALAIACFVVIAHRANVRRLLHGEEHRFRRRSPSVTP
jgi:glycerol-3-phosphate acyltransferase PlsY